MTDQHAERLTAWGQQLRAVHQRLRDALDVARETIEDGRSPDSLAGDLLLYCGGFCAALAGHHRSEDAALFPLVLRDRPDLEPTVARLKQDHSMIGYLIQAMEQALRSGAGSADLLRHLDGIDAIMESHFRFEEQQLLQVMDAMTIEIADRERLFGPLG